MACQTVDLETSTAVLAWSEAAQAGPRICGGKGHNLGRLARYGFRIPRGGVIPAQWYSEVLGHVSRRALDFLAGVPAEQAADAGVAGALEDVRNAIAAAR